MLAPRSFGWAVVDERPMPLIPCPEQAVIRPIRDEIDRRIKVVIASLDLDSP